MTLKRTTPTPPRERFDASKIAAFIASLAIGHIRTRTGEGLDVEDAPFAVYSTEYAETRAELGRNTGFVDLLMSGGMLNSVRVVDSSGGADSASVTIGVGTGTSPRVRPPSKTRRRGGSRTGSRGPAHNLLARWHNEGTGRNPKRKWFGVSAQGSAMLERETKRVLAKFLENK